MNRTSRVAFKEIARIHAPSKEQFMTEFWSKNKPVIITGGFDEWPAMNKWSLEYFKKELGSITTDVRLNTSTKQYRQGNTYLNHKMRVDKYIEELENDTPASRNRYLAVQNVKQQFPTLLGDYSVPIYVPKTHRGPFLWVAQAGHFEYIHVDPDDNFLCILSGCKRVRLFSPDQFSKMSVNPLGSLGYTLQTQMDLSFLSKEAGSSEEEEFFKEFPNFTGAVCEECDLRRGDMLFIPFGYWHQVTSEEVTISINFFCGDETDAFIGKLMADPAVWHTFEYWFLNIIEQNRQASEGDQWSFCDIRYTKEQLQKCFLSFMITRYKERPTQEEADKLIESALRYCEKRDREQWDKACGGDGTYEERRAACTPSKIPPKMKIRGKLWRSTSSPSSS